jgi:ATP/ADP translocase
LTGSAVVDVLLWALIAKPATWTLYLLYTWSGVFASLVVVRFWTFLSDLFSIGQAKRVFALIGAGEAGAPLSGRCSLVRSVTTSNHATSS